MQNKVVKIRNLILWDFICALSGAFFYYELFDILIDYLSLPRALVQGQLIANLAYALYGIILYLSRTERWVFFKFLVIMNFVYAGLCIVIGVTLSTNNNYLGTSLLLIEGGLIAALATYELNALKSVSN
jgi:hypothetical protein